MFIDFRTVDDDALVEADLCVIGGGAAGITLAREFIGSGLKICIVESGGLELDPDTQDLYRGDLIGLPYYPLDATRLRYFGGTTNHWTGWCAPLNASDFEAKPWVPHSGWPFRRPELEPYYERAQPLFELGPYLYDDQLWERFEIEAPELDPQWLEHCFWQQSPPTRFGEVYRAELERVDDVTLLLHASVTDIRTNDAASAVEDAVLRTQGGKAGRVRARAFVLACGGIENARLLLASNRHIEPAGLGNQNGLVGRFFMEHPQLSCGIVVTDDPYGLVQTYGRRRRDGVLYKVGFRLAEDLRAREGVLNGSAEMKYVPGPETGAVAAVTLWRDLRRGHVSGEWAARIWRVLTDLDNVANYAYQRLTREAKVPLPPSIAYFDLIAVSEQAPNPESRVTLSPTERDALGMSRPQLDWRMTENDKRTIELLTRIIGAELARLGLGRVRLQDWLLDGKDAWPPELGGSHHHMGTTRMADDPKAGVVDRDCRVHSVDNLYVASSSVFPTGGHANPTLTIVALALRLAEHLKGRYARNQF